MRVTLEWMTPDAERRILRMARVSSPQNQDSEDTRLIDYLIRHAHWSPFEMANMCVEIETSRAISAQLIRHKSFSFQELSQRYAVVPTREPVELRQQAVKNRQSSAAPIDDPETQAILDAALVHAETTYLELVSRGVAKECARMVLPMCTQTRLYVNGSIRSWIHYINLRTQEDTQREHRQMALAIQALFVQELPIISRALSYE